MKASLKTIVAGSLLALASMSASAGSNNGLFNVNATVSNDCAIATDGFAWTGVGLTNRNYDTGGNLKVNCVGGTPFAVKYANSVPTGYSMNSGAKSIKYDLYTDAGYSTKPATVAGTVLASGIATGSEDVIPVYGRIPVQTLMSGTDSVGSYTGTINLNVEF